MADYPIEALGGLTPLQYASTPSFDHLARMGRSGLITTVPDGLPPSSDVANLAILGYNTAEVYEGRGVLEAAGSGYRPGPDDMVMRCNLVSVSPDGILTGHNGGGVTAEEGRQLIALLDNRLGSDRVRLIAGDRYRHLLVIKGGSKHIVCNAPHDHIGGEWMRLLVSPAVNAPDEPGRMSAAATADLLNALIKDSHHLLSGTGVNKRCCADALWPWSPGYPARIAPLASLWPGKIEAGAVITATDVIRGIGRYAGLDIIDVPGATGTVDTCYEAKARAAIDALRTHDFVFLHIEGADEASHEGDLGLKLQAIERTDSRLTRIIVDELTGENSDVGIALLPDHFTSVERRVHGSDPVPVTIYIPGVEPDSVDAFDETSCAEGALGRRPAREFMELFMQ